jgi:hypothetical protein
MVDQRFVKSSASYHPRNKLRHSGFHGFLKGMGYAHVSDFFAFPRPAGTGRH